MDRINLSGFYQLGFVLHPVTQLKDEMAYGQLAIWTGPLTPLLESLTQGQPVKLRNKAPVDGLLEAIKSATPKEAGEGFKGWREAQNTKI